MASDIFGGGCDDDVGAVLDWTDEANPDRIIDNEGHAGFVGDASQGGKVRDVELGVADGFGVDRPGARGDGFAESGEVLRIHEVHGASQLRQSVMEELVSAAIEVIGGNDFVSEAGDIEHGQRGGRLAGRYGQRAHAAFDGRHPVLKHVGGRVHDPRINVPEFLQGKEVRGVLGALERERSGLVNRHRARAGGRIRDLAGVQCQRGEFVR